MKIQPEGIELFYANEWTDGCMAGYTQSYECGIK
jgi:hypothetical protein